MTPIELIAVVFGLLCVWLTIRQNIWCWPTGLIQVALYVVIFFQVRLYHGAAHPRLAQLAENTRYRYDLFFLCGDEIPYDDTWDRSGYANRSIFQKQTRADLLHRRIPFIDLKGPLDVRIETVKEVLAGFDKFDSVANSLKNKQCEQAGAVNLHAFGTFGTSAAEQPLVPKASGDT